MYQNENESFAWLGSRPAMVGAGLLLLAVSVLLWLSWFVMGRHYALGWDYSVYTGAVRALAAGEDPYRFDVLQRYGVAPQLAFVSPPTVAMVMQAIALSPLKTAYGPVLIILHIIAMLATPWLFARLFFDGMGDRVLLVYGTFLAMFAGAGVFTAAVVNNGTVLYALLIAASLDGFLNKRWTFFHAAVVLATIFKPFYAAMWIIPVLAHGFSWRQVLIGTAGVVVAAASYGVVWLVAPDLFADWVRMLSQHLMMERPGDAVFAAALHFHHGRFAATLIPYMVQLAYMALVVAAVLFSPLKGQARWAALIAAAVFLDPRLMVYDKVIASIPVVYLAAAVLPSRFDINARFVACAVSLSIATSILTEGLHLPGSVIFPLLVLGLLAFTVLRRPVLGRPETATLAASI